MPAAKYPRQSLRQDAAMRASRDGDLSTLKALIDQASLFEDAAALRRACESGLWGAPAENSQLSVSKSLYSTKDSILLHNLLQSATTRGHADVIGFLLKRFPAQKLHVAEWELIVVALSSGKVKVLKPYLDIDPESVQMVESRFGNCYQLVLSMNDEPEDILPMMEFLKETGADVNAGGMGKEVRQRLDDIFPAKVAQSLSAKLQIDHTALDNLNSASPRTA
jgi:hypothetical protein